MFYTKLRCFAALCCIVLLSGCAYQKEYNRVSKNGTIEDKYNFALKAYDKQDYKKSSAVFEELLPLFRGKDALEGLLYNLAYSYFYDKDYYMAAYYFLTLSRQFPNGSKVEEATYMSAYCKTLESPDFRLDQSATKEAIKQLQLYINYYPDSPRVEEASRLIVEMRKKLALKAFNIAGMYYRRNLYNAAAICYNNFLRDFPESPDREQAMFLMLKCRYLYAKNSFKHLQPERYRKVVDIYDLFLRSYADSRYRDDADKLVQTAKEKM